MSSEFSIFIFKSFFILLVLAGFVFVALLIIRKFFNSGKDLPEKYQKQIFAVGLPKEVFIEDAKKEANRDNIIEQISQAEEFFTSIGGLHAQSGWHNWFFGRGDHFSFEIVARQGKIYFYVVAPKYLSQYLEQQIHAQYPHAQINQIEDYNIFNPNGVVAAAYLYLTRPSLFPIKTYRQMDSDPLDAITNSLSKLTEDEGVVIQIIARSSKKSWRKISLKVVHEMQQGKTLQQALKLSGANALFGRVGNTFFNVIKDMFLVGFTGKTKQENKLEQQNKGITVPNKLSAKEEEVAKLIEEKASKAGLDINIRIVTSAITQQQAENRLRGITNAFSQYSIFEYGNKFNHIISSKLTKIVNNFIYRNFDEKHKFILNTEELASIYHFPLSTCATPNIEWLTSRKAPAPVEMPTEGIILGRNVYRNKETQVRMTDADRRRHVYIIGMTGVGKSVLMENMIRQDIEAGKGVCVVDPHGSLAETVLGFVPKSRAEDVVYFNPADIERPIGLNILEATTPEEMDFVTQEMVSIFYKLVTDPSMIGPMFEHNMRNAMLTLMSDKEHPGTIAEIPRMFTDEEFQKYKLKFVTDPMVRAFWEKEMAKTSDYHKSEMLGYLISKVGRFIENEMIRNIIGQSKSGFSFREVMDRQKILIINLSKGQVGEVNSNLLGLIAVSKLQMAALARANMPEDERKDFYLYIDEFQNYVTDSIATILAEARKYKLNLIMAHQYIGQLVNQQDTSIRDAVFGNAGTMIAFRVGVEDAETMAKQFAPVFAEYDVMNIEKYNAYIRLLIDNTAVRPFNMSTYPPVQGNYNLAEKIKELSRLKYGRSRREVTAEILANSKLGEATKESLIHNAEASL